MSTAITWNKFAEVPAPLGRKLLLVFKDGGMGIGYSRPHWSKPGVIMWTCGGGLNVKADNIEAWSFPPLPPEWMKKDLRKTLTKAEVLAEI